MATLYRKYRSKYFKEIIGQDYIVRVLKQAVKESKYSHAYLFAGPRGTGKTSTARILAKALNCMNLQKDGEPCNECSNCMAINNGRFLDLLEIDAASNRGIEEIRSLKEKVNFLPVEGRVKMYIIDEVHMMTNEAFNALLKTLEEPPPNVVFILATTEVHKIPLTIVSRTQKFDFKLADNQSIFKKLKLILDKEKIGFDNEAVDIMVEGGEGSFRDAETILEKVITVALSQKKKKITRESVEEAIGLIDKQSIKVFFEALVKRDRQEAMQIFAKVRSRGFNIAQFVKQVLELGRKSMMKTIHENGTNVRQILNVLKEMNNAANEMKYSIVSDLPVELALVSLTSDSGDNNNTAVSETDLSEKDSKKKVTVFKKPGKYNSNQKNASVNIEALMEKWQSFLNHAKKYNHFLGAIIAKAVPDIEEEGDIVLKVPTAFHKKQIENKDTRIVVKEILGQVYGLEITFRCIVDRSLNQYADSEENYLDSISNEKLVEEILL